MERLTVYENLAGVMVGDLKTGVDERKAFDLLAHYEDTGLEPEEITTRKPACVFYCNRQCNLNGDFCAEGPGCPFELDSESALKLLEERSPNDPLTLEELRKMDGEPVWVVNSKSKRNDGFQNEWAIVSVRRRDAESVGTIYHFDNYGDYWLAYPRKLEEGKAKNDKLASPTWAEHFQSRFERVE